MAQSHFLLGVLCIIAGEFLMASMGALIKWIGPEMPTEQIILFRNLFGLVFLLPFLIRQGRHALRTERVHLHVVRALVGITAMYCMYFTMARLPLTEAVLLKQTAPFFIPLIAFLWLQERITALTIFAIFLGFVGVLLVLNPQGANLKDWPIALVGLAGALFAATAKVTIRSMGASEPSARIVFYFNLICSLIALVPACLRWVTPTPSQWLGLAAIALLATWGQLLSTQAYRVAEAGRIGQFTFSSVIFAAILGWAIWQEPFELHHALGCGLVIAAGWLNLRGTSIKGKVTSSDQPQRSSS